MCFGSVVHSTVLYITAVPVRRIKLEYNFIQTIDTKTKLSLTFRYNFLLTEAHIIAIYWEGLLPGAGIQHGI